MGFLFFLYKKISKFFEFFDEHLYFIIVIKIIQYFNSLRLFNYLNLLRL